MEIKSDMGGRGAGFGGAGISTAIKQTGGWKSTRTPLQYAEKINAARSDMTRAAAATGRDAPLACLSAVRANKCRQQQVTHH
jgi:hypothetical protein